jgi:hypothetical protein
MEPSGSAQLQHRTLTQVRYNVKINFAIVVIYYPISIVVI